MASHKNFHSFSMFNVSNTIWLTVNRQEDFEIKYLFKTLGYSQFFKMQIHWVGQLQNSEFF